MFEILMYLFENYMDGSVALSADQETIYSELEQAGFNPTEIGQALDWLDGLNRAQQQVQQHVPNTPHSIRHFLAEESELLNVDVRGYLLYLEQINILDPVTREIVIDRLMVLDPREVDLGRVKWVVLIALFNQPDKKSALSLLQDIVLSDALGALH